MQPAAITPPMRLLITERQQSSRDALMSLLRTTDGFEFIGAVPPEMAIQQAVIQRATVVLLDVLKPHTASAALCQALCALSPRPIVIALTSFGEPEEEQALRAAGADSYLLKEVSFKKLIDTVTLIFVRHHAGSVHGLPNNA